MAVPSLAWTQAQKRGSARRGLQPGPQRERGLWTFLTWSFFLSEVLVAEGLLGGGAHAREEAEPVVSGSADGTQLAPISMPPVVAYQATENDSDHATNTAAGNASALLHESGTGGPTILDAGDDGRAAEYGVSAGSATIALGPVTGGETLAAEGEGGDADIAILPLITEVLDVVDTALEQTFTPIERTVGGVLNMTVPTLTELVGTVAETAVTAIDSVHQLFPLGQQLVTDVVAPAGDIVFRAAAESVVDELFSAGRYTDYALQIGHEQSAPSSMLTASDGSMSVELVDYAMQVTDDVVHLQQTLAQLGLQHTIDDTLFR